MDEQYINYIAAFKRLSKENKKNEIINHINELKDLIDMINKKLNTTNQVLPIISNSNNEDEFLTELFTYIISLKEENGKLVEYLIRNGYL